MSSVPATSEPATCFDLDDVAQEVCVDALADKLRHLNLAIRLALSCGVPVEELAEEPRHERR